MLTSNGVVDSGATGHFLQTGVGISTGEASNKAVGMSNGKIERATQQLFPLNKLSEEARKGDGLPSLQHNSPISVPTLSDHCYTTVFKSFKEGVEVYKSSDSMLTTKDKTAHQRWQDDNGLWRAGFEPHSTVGD